MTGSHDPFSPSYISTTVMVWRWLRGKGPDWLFLLVPRTGAYWAAGYKDWRRSMSYFKIKASMMSFPLFFGLRFWKDSNFIFAGLPNGLNPCISPVFSSSLEPRSNLDRCSYSNVWGSGVMPWFHPSLPGILKFLQTRLGIWRSQDL